MRPPIPTAAASLALAAVASAQTTFWEVEPNDSKDQATPAQGMRPGDLLAAGFEGCPASTSDPEIFRVRTIGMPRGIWRHRLVPVTNLFESYPRILGRSQWNGTVAADSTTVLQQSGDWTTPARFVQWYGFGRAEEVFVDLDHTNACFSRFLVELESTPVAPVDLSATFEPGFVDVVANGASTPVDTEVWLYDADFRALPRWGNDEDPRGGPSGARSFVRALLLPGTYYLAVADHPFANHRPRDAVGEARPWGDVADFDGVAVGGSPTAGHSIEVSVNGWAGGSEQVVVVKDGPYDVSWVRFHVASGEGTSTVCVGDGTEGACICGPDARGTGAGCANSTGRGATLVVQRGPSPFEWTATASDLPPAASALLFLAPATVPPTPVLAASLCIGGGALRVGAATADGVGTAEFPTLDPWVLGLPPGESVVTQVVYRDPAAELRCSVNATSGVRVVLP